MNANEIQSFLLFLGNLVCDTLRNQTISMPLESRSRVHAETAEDTIYAIDHLVDCALVEQLERRAEELGGLVVFAEGFDAPAGRCFPPDLAADSAAWRILIDPLDGTRGLMLDKRSAFFLAGAAPGGGHEGRLSEIVHAVMVEIPTSRSVLSDVIVAEAGRGATRWTRDCQANTTVEAPLRPSRETTIAGGYAQFAKFFPPGRDRLARIEEELIDALLPNRRAGEVSVFEDQYISSGGQLYELLLGRDRFTADLRAALYVQLEQEGIAAGHACHPYDLAAHLIGNEAGLILTDLSGQPLDAPLTTTANVNWIGYANNSIRQQVEPMLQRLLKQERLL